MLPAPLPEAMIVIYFFASHSFSFSLPPPCRFADAFQLMPVLSRCRHFFARDSVDIAA